MCRRTPEAEQSGYDCIWRYDIAGRLVAGPRSFSTRLYRDDILSRPDEGPRTSGGVHVEDAEDDWVAGTAGSVGGRGLASGFGHRWHEALDESERLAGDLAPAVVDHQRVSAAQNLGDLRDVLVVPLLVVGRV